MHHHDAGQLGGGIGGLHQVTGDGAIDALEGNRFRLEARIVGGDQGGLGIIVLEHGENGHRRCTRAGELGQLGQEAAPVEGDMGVFVIKADHLRRDLGLGIHDGRSPGCYGSQQTR